MITEEFVVSIGVDKRENCSEKGAVKKDITFSAISFIVFI